MSRTLPSKRIAVLASGIMLLLARTALAQPVSVFDDAPTIEQLRSIMIPESHSSVSRSIVIQMPDEATPSAPVQQASTQAMPAATNPVAKKRHAAPVVQAAVSMPAPKADGNAVAFHVNFASNSATLPDSAREMIDMIAQLMKETPTIKVRVEGHTDAAGSPRYNLALSERRALSVGQYIASQGIEPGRLELVGKGMADPITANKYDPANRRVQFVRID